MGDKSYLDWERNIIRGSTSEFRSFIGLSGSSPSASKQTYRGLILRHYHLPLRKLHLLLNQGSCVWLSQTPLSRKTRKHRNILLLDSSMRIHPLKEEFMPLSKVFGVDKGVIFQYQRWKGMLSFSESPARTQEEESWHRASGKQTDKRCSLQSGPPAYSRINRSLKWFLSGLSSRVFTTIFQPGRSEGNCWSSGSSCLTPPFHREPDRHWSGEGLHYYRSKETYPRVCECEIREWRHILYLSIKSVVAITLLILQEGRTHDLQV